MIHYFIKLLSAVIVIVLMPSAHAFNESMHDLVMASLKEELPTQQQLHFQTLAQKLVERMNAKSISSIGEVEFPEDIKTLSLFPSIVDKYSLGSVYRTYGQIIPPALSPYRSITSGLLHYELLPDLLSTTRCPYRPSSVRTPALLRALNQAYKDSPTLIDKAITLAFIVHITIDIHNPLHTTTQLTHQCKPNGGGRKTCIEHVGGKCRNSLYRAVSAGYGISDIGIENPFPQIDIKSPYTVESIFSENLSFSQIIFDPQYWSEPDSIIIGKLIQSRLSTSVERLRILLKGLYEYDNN